MTQDEERAYIQGQQATWRTLLGQACRELGPDSAEATAERWRIERSDAIRILREVCSHFGDNDWPDNLHLADIIDKHLWRYLGDK